MANKYLKKVKDSAKFGEGDLDRKIGKGLSWLKDKFDLSGESFSDKFNRNRKRKSK